MFDRSKKGEHALLIQPHFGKLEEDVLEEFSDLARSAGAGIAATITARRRPAPSTIGQARGT